MNLPELLDRITAARKHAEGRMERATFQAEYRDGKELVRLLEDVRDYIAWAGGQLHAYTSSAQGLGVANLNAVPAQSGQLDGINAQGLAGNTLKLKGKAA